MAFPSDLRHKLIGLLEEWHHTGLPVRSVLIHQGKKILLWREENKINGLWPEAPELVTATLDDGFGHGLEIIHLYAEILGLRTRFLGLLQDPETVISACHRLQPAFLGLTVLQFDTEETLKHIRKNLPDHTRLIAGGPVFKADPEYAVRSGVDFAAENVAKFLEYLLDAAPPSSERSGSDSTGCKA